jgi:hypothetical protein
LALDDRLKNIGSLLSASYLEKFLSSNLSGIKKELLINMENQ